MKNNGDTANAVVLTGSCLCNPLFRYDGPAHGNDGAFDLKIDETGNVYVTGYSIGAAGNYDYLTIKYDTDGVRRWLARYNGPGFAWMARSILPSNQSVPRLMFM